MATSATIPRVKAEARKLASLVDEQLSVCRALRSDATAQNTVQAKHIFCPCAAKMFGRCLNLQRWKEHHLGENGKAGAPVAKKLVSAMNFFASGQGDHGPDARRHQRPTTGSIWNSVEFLRVVVDECRSFGRSRAQTPRTGSGTKTHSRSFRSCLETYRRYESSPKRKSILSLGAGRHGRRRSKAARDAALERWYLSR